jgi:ABC-type polysaccharide/polyol phosphate transport system ATPase subunit
MPATAAAAQSVVADGVSKAFKLPQEQVHTIKERALHPLRRARYERLQALDDVSFDVRGGEFFGIVGRNGSGKSTLLKCLAGIYATDAGRIALRGRMAPFIELGVGFNPDLTARDNVLINSVMLGLSPAEARNRFDAVIEFAELEEFIDMKLKNYSSGMHVRLAFAVMTQVDADVLLIDEVLAVGDAAFQQKCHDTLDAMRAEGRTILFVTHDMHAVEQKCDRVLLLERGRMEKLGEAREVARLYNQLNFGEVETLAGERSGDGAASVLDAWFEDASGTRAPTLDTGTPAVFRMTVRFERAVPEARFSIAIEDDAHRRIFATSPADAGLSGPFAAGEQVELRMEFENVLAPGRYHASPWVGYPGTGSRAMDHRERMAPVTVLGARSGRGVIDLPHTLSAMTPERTP